MKNQKSQKWDEKTMRYKKEWAEITKYADMRKGCTTHINQKFREEHDYNRLIMYRNPYLNDGKNSRHFQQQELGI